MSPHSLVTNTLICLLALTLAACGGDQPADPRTEAPVVRVSAAEPANPGAMQFTGTVSARVHSDLGFRVGGKVVQRLVESGQLVRRGQVLMRIDPTDLQLATQAQHEALSAAKARHEQASADEARLRDLKGTGAISDSSYDQAKAAADAAKAQLQAAQAQVEVARNATRYADMVADADGVITDTMAEPGQVVAAGQPVLRLAQAGAREAVVQLPETLRPQIGAAAFATLSGGDGKQAPSRLRQLSASADRMTRTYEARFLLEGRLANAPLGATVVVQLPARGADSTPPLSVPLGSLINKGDRSGIWVVDGEPAKVAWRPVSVLSVGDEAAVVSGEVKEGERVVAMGAHLMSPGLAVRVSTPAKVSTAAKVRP